MYCQRVHESVPCNPPQPRGSVATGGLIDTQKWWVSLNKKKILQLVEQMPSADNKSSYYKFADSDRKI